MNKQRTANSVLTVCLSQGDNRIKLLLFLGLVFLFFLGVFAVVRCLRRVVFILHV
jgi:hypothetical protein